MGLPKGNYFVVENEDLSSHIADGVNIELFDQLNDSKLFNGKEWHSYRLGDHFRGIMTNPELYPGSLMYDYYKSKKTKDRFGTLFFLVKTREIYNFDSSQFLLVGLRIGDIFGNRSDRLGFYLYFPEDYQNLELGAELNKTVILCCGSHVSPNIKHTKKYLLEIYNVFKLKGFQKIVFRIGNNPDNDFILMANAVNFIPGKGNYHKLIRDMNLKYKNINVVEMTP